MDGVAERAFTEGPPRRTGPAGVSVALYGGEGGRVAAVGAVAGGGQGPSRGLVAPDISTDGGDEEGVWGSEFIDDSMRCIC